MVFHPESRGEHRMCWGWHGNRRIIGGFPGSATQTSEKTGRWEVKKIPWETTPKKKKNTNAEIGQYVIQQTLAKYKPCTDSININRE